MARITAIQDRSVVDLALVKSEFGITVASYDVRLTRAIAAAKEAGDAYCNNKFVDTDEDGNETERPIPQQVEEGILRWVSLSVLESYGSVGTDPAGKFVTEARTGTVQMKYSGTPQSSTGESLDGFTDLKRRYWWDHRLLPGY